MCVNLKITFKKVLKVGENVIFWRGEKNDFKTKYTAKIVYYILLIAFTRIELFNFLTFNCIFIKFS